MEARERGGEGEEETRELRRVTCHRFFLSPCTRAKTYLYCVMTMRNGGACSAFQVQNEF